MHHQKRRLTTTFRHPQKSIQMYHSQCFRCMCLSHVSCFIQYSIESRQNSDAEGVDRTSKISPACSGSEASRCRQISCQRGRESVSAPVSGVPVDEERTWSDEAIELWLKITLSKTKAGKLFRFGVDSNHERARRTRKFIGWKVIFLCLSPCSIVPARPQTLYFPITDFFPY